MLRFRFRAMMFYRLIVLAVVLLVLPAAVLSQKVRLRSKITPVCASGSNLRFADIFAEGTTAVQGSYGCRGVFIYDLTDPDSPVLASWYNPGSDQQFLEAIIFNGRGYFGSGNGGGVHIVDLTNPYAPAVLGVVTPASGAGFSSIHEMVVFRQNGRDYLIENFNGFTSKLLKIIDITVPASPFLVRELNPSEPVWVHAMVVRGNRLFTSGWGSGASRGRTEIYDIANIASQAPTLLGFIEDTTSITAGNNMHSSWPSEDGKFLYSCRETNNGTGDVRVYNISDPATPLLVNSLTMQDLGLNAVSPHNPVVMGNYLYVSWYQAGVQVFDITSPASPTHVGQYDTFENAFAQPPDEERSLAEAEPWDLVCGSEFRQNLLPTSYDGNWAVFPFLGQDKVLAGDLRNGLLVLDASEISGTPRNEISDFDGDSKTDLSVFRPSDGAWQIQFSGSPLSFVSFYGQNGDIIQPGDYDGDGLADRAIFRPSTGTWWISRTTDPVNSLVVQFGASSDIPVAADYDSDGRVDIAVWRPSTGVWYIMQSTLGIKTVIWGAAGDKPVFGDFEGDGKMDVAVWRPSNGAWYVLPSSTSIPFGAAWGTLGDKPATGDFDGNGVTDFAIYRPANGTWYILDPSNQALHGYAFGIAEDIPVPADYDGDGRADVSVFRPSTNVWYRLNSANATGFERAFGQSGDRPSPSSVQPQ